MSYTRIQRTPERKHSSGVVNNYNYYAFLHPPPPPLTPSTTFRDIWTNLAAVSAIDGVKRFRGKKKKKATTNLMGGTAFFDSEQKRVTRTDRRIRV